MFEKFRKKPEEELELTSPAKGKCIPLSEVPDPVFAEGILGKGVAILLTEGKIVSPVNGVVTTAFHTGHAVSLRSKGGAEILIHVGLDTVKLGGKYFRSNVKENQKVKKGDTLIEVDYKAAEAEGYNMVTPVVICNSDDYMDVEGITGDQVTYEDQIIRFVPQQ